MKLTDDLIVTNIPAIELTDEQKAIWASWIVALRSGNFAQGNGCLKTFQDHAKTVIGHCCLGVLCDTIYPQHLKKLNLLFKQIPENSRDWILIREEALEDLPETRLSASLDAGLCKYIGIPDPLGFRVNTRSDNADRALAAMPNLAGLNDAGVPFAKIADILAFAMNGGYSEATNEA
jgi:hypothetical protein